MEVINLSFLHLIRRSLLHHWRSAVLLSLGVVAATAVVTGALLVGDSMRGSLRQLTFERLGKVDLVIAPRGFFNQSLGEKVELAISANALPVKQQTYPRAVPIMMFPQSVVETANGNPVRRVGSVQSIACDERFWELDSTGVAPRQLPIGDQAILNQAAATELGVAIGDLITVRLPTEQAVPADNPLGRRDVGTESLPRLTVVGIVPDRGLGRFSLTANQQQAANVYLPLRLVQDTLDRDEQANVLLIDSDDWRAGDPRTAAEWTTALSNKLELTLEDYGLRLKKVERIFAPDDAAQSETVFSYWSLTSDQLLLPDEVVYAARMPFNEIYTQSAMTYLANSVTVRTSDASLASEERVRIPYSMITGIDDSRLFSLFELSNETLPDAAKKFARSKTLEAKEAVPIVLNNWAAERLSAKLGDHLDVKYFEPETVGGQEVEASMVAVVVGIVPLTKPERPYSRKRDAEFSERPTRFNDADLTPQVPGVTDQSSIGDWDLPFDLSYKIDKEDDQYWNDHRLTPKFFVPYEVAKKRFGSRFGNATSVLFDARTSESYLRTATEFGLRAVRKELGWGILPVRAQQLAASRGSTPFDLLFLALSFFVIVAALLLILLLTRLGLEQRATEYGALLATGWSDNQVRRYAQTESAIVVAIGSTFGVLLGIAYSALILYLLRTWWVGAVTVPFLELHLTLRSLLVGWLSGGIIASMAVFWVLRRMKQVSNLRLLRGSLESSESHVGEASRAVRWTATTCIVAGIGLGAAAFGLRGQAQAGAFVCEGMLILIGLLASYRIWLGRHRPTSRATRLSLIGLANRNGGRNPHRSVLTAGLLAVAGFMILAMGAFRIDPNPSGAGGFDLTATTVQPIYRDLNQPEVLDELLGKRDAERVAGAQFLMIRERSGQDASCNNLYQATQPRVLGLPPAIEGLQQSASDVAFAWAAGDRRIVWEQLKQKASGGPEDPIPVVIDQNTAMWSLQMMGGVGQEKGFDYPGSGLIYFRVVGLLANSLLQGSLLISEENFIHVFPNVTGYQRILIRSDGASANTLTEVLENRLSDSGVDVQDSMSQLARLLEVQNTYLRTFQGLGAIGLLLGTFGLAVAQTRSVIERRGELALLRAVGFADRRLANLVLWETVQLLLGGLTLAIVSASLALVPFAVLGQAQVGWQEPMAFLAVALACGLAVSILAIHRALAVPLLPALRGL